MNQNSAELGASRRNSNSNRSCGGDVALSWFDNSDITSCILRLKSDRLALDASQSLERSQSWCLNKNRTGIVAARFDSYADDCRNCFMRLDDGDITADLSRLECERLELASSECVGRDVDND